MANQEESKAAPPSKAAPESNPEKAQGIQITALTDFEYGGVSYAKGSAVRVHPEWLPFLQGAGVCTGS
jgi:hypothetical protein